MMKRCSLATIRSVWALLALLVAGIGSASRADTHSYASQPRQIKAGILVTNAAPGIVGTGPENAVPYVFYIMDRRADLKPAGWSFINPLAPPTLTGDIVQRWKNRDGNNLDTSLNDTQFKVGAQVNKNIGAYWEVNLDSVSADDLHQFNLLLM